ncbi:MAG TPA: AAA family ATPase [Phycisphaerales bacterium]|nr:AAA family ATPase [Phycisphaerales bacterium]HMP38679.1 AAA family ATPase [Phycisphaerales bacterium]
MLIEFFGENFGCFRDEFRLSMEATDIDPNDDRGVRTVPLADGTSIRLLRSAVIYGPNASGKSTIIRAAGVLRSLIWLSALLPQEHPLLDELHEPYLLEGSARRPVRLGAVVRGGAGVVYRYEVEFDRTKIGAERLTELMPAKTTLFERRDKSVTGRWSEDPMFTVIKSDFRDNALLLSLTASLAPHLASSIANEISRSLQAGPNAVGRQRLFPPSIVGDSMRVARLVRENPSFGSWLERQIRRADLGVDRIVVHERRAGRDSEQPSLFNEPGPDRPEVVGGRSRSLELRLEHRAAEGTYRMPYSRESLGTKQLIKHSPVIHGVMSEEPAIAAWVDELDASMHPNLFEMMVRSVNQPESPSGGGQLIFTAHETIIIDGEARDAAMRRDQIWYTSKASDGAARLYSQAEFRERHNVNLRRRYLQGRYGAIPAIGGE